MNTRALTTNGGIRNFLCDEELERGRIVVEGTDASHVKYPDATTDVPIGITVDGTDAAEEAVAVALFGRGETKFVKINGTCSKGDYLTAEDPSTAAIGQARAVPATAGAFFVIGKAAEDGIDEQEVAFDDCCPFIAGAQDGNGQLGIPSFAADPATPVPGQLIVNSTDNALKAYIDSAWRTIAFLSLVIGLMLSGIFAQAADKTPVVLGDATTGQIAAAGAGDNVKVPGTLEVTGASTLTGAVSAASTLEVTGASTLTGAVTAASTIAATGAVTGSGGLGLAVISETFAFGDFTDNTDATGYVDFSTQIPAGSIVLGWECVVATGFTGDTTATVQVGIAGTLDKYSVNTTQSVLAAATVGASAKLSASTYEASAATARVTVTGGASFSSISAGEMTVKIFYIATP